MSNTIQQMLKLSGMLTLLLSTTIYGSSKANALDPSQLPIVGQALQRGMAIEPTLRILDTGLTGNNLQFCIAGCTLPSNAPRPAASIGALPQQMLQLPNQLLQVPQQVLQPTPQPVQGQIMQPQLPPMQQAAPAPNQVGVAQQLGQAVLQQQLRR